MTGGSTRVQSRLRRLLGVAAAAMLAVAAVGCGTGSGEGSAGSSEQGGPVTLEFAQWWAPELPEGSFQELMTQFESQNPNIKVEAVKRSIRVDQAATGIRGGIEDSARRRGARRCMGE